MKIVLIGFMGSGKTTTAKMLSKALGVELIDIDKIIVQKSKRNSVQEIFDLDGEDKFRMLESVAALEMDTKDSVIISTGGGIIMNEQNMSYLKNKAVTVFLKCKFETSKKRVGEKKSRPLFRDEKNALKLFNLRQPLYAGYSDIVVETDNEKPKEVVEKIIEELKLYGNNS